MPHSNSAVEPGSVPPERTRPVIRVLLIDDDREFCLAVRRALAHVPYINVVGAAFDGRTALAYARALVPDAAVVDLSLNGDGPPATAVLETLRFERPRLVLVALAPEEADGSGGSTRVRDLLLERRAQEAGADAVLPRDEFLDVLVQTIADRASHNGEVY